MLKTQLDETPNLASAHSKSSEQGSSDLKHVSRSPSKGRSFSESSSPALSPSPSFREPAKLSKDDTSIRDSPTTPRRPAFPRGLSLQMPPRDFLSIHSRIPLSPLLDSADTYGSPVIPRRSRGLDFSRAATNLHHSTLAEQSSPDSSPTITGRGINIPNRRSGHFTGSSESPSGPSASLWSTRADWTAVSSSLGSVNMLGSESSGSSSDDDDLMDADDIDESILITPQVHKLPSITGGAPQASPGTGWMAGYSPAVSSLMNFQRSRMRYGRNRTGSSSGSGSSMASPKSKSPPMLGSIEAMSNTYFTAELPPGATDSRRESISWAANQLHISGSESDDNTLKSTLENAEGLPSTPGRDGQRGVIRRAVTRRGNMLPKTKGFARIRAALAEESAPIETEVRREATIVRQVRENDMDLEPTRHYASSTAQSSPSVTAAPTDSLEDIPEDDIMAESSTGLHDKRHSSSFKHQALLNSKGKEFWKSFPDSQPHSTPPPPAFLPLGSSSGISDDISIDSPSLSTPPSSLCGRGFALPSQSQSNEYNELRPQSQQPTPVPTSADITRKVNNKRRRDDDFDPSSFKRRAVSPGMSVQNSPVMQSPMQRDINPWGAKQSNSCGTEKAPVDGAGGPNGRLNGTKRVGLQGMVDTNDGLMKMSIE